MATPSEDYFFNGLWPENSKVYIKNGPEALEEIVLTRRSQAKTSAVCIENKIQKNPPEWRLEITEY
ncbi:hypothetical protein GCM10028808_26200 [Spirosoma migulaei]